MPETVSKLAGFVFARGALAEAILFRNLEEDGEVPGVTSDERSAMNEAVGLLRDEWLALLHACRAAVLERAEGHHAYPTLLASMGRRDSTLWKKGELWMPLVARNRANCGVGIAAGPEGPYRLFVWVWTQARLRQRARDAIAPLSPQPKRNEQGSFVLSIGTPEEGHRYADWAGRAAEKLWSMAEPIADAIVGKSELTIPLRSDRTGSLVIDEESV